MIDDSDLNAKKIAYIDRIRGMHKNKRNLGFLGCLLGVLIMLAGRYSPQVPDWTVWAGVAVVAAGWLLFAYVIFSRVTYVRTHPFDPETN